GPSQQQVREIYACDEQNGSDGAPQCDQRAPEFAGDVIFQRAGNQVAFVASQGLRVFGVEVNVGRDAVGVVKGLGNGHAGLEAANEGDNIAPHAFSIEIKRDK